MTHGKGQEWGPPDGPSPSNGGHIIRTPEDSGSFPRTQGGPDLLPVFGGPPCTDTCGKSSKPPPADVSATSVSSHGWEGSLLRSACRVFFDPPSTTWLLFPTQIFFLKPHPKP